MRENGENEILSGSLKSFLNLPYVLFLLVLMWCRTFSLKKTYIVHNFIHHK